MLHTGGEVTAQRVLGKMELLPSGCDFLPGTASSSSSTEMCRITSPLTSFQREVTLGLLSQEDDTSMSGSL